MASLSERLQRSYAPIWAPPGDFDVAGGKGCYLFDSAGKRYIDFVTGIAVNALGYQHPDLTRAYKSFAGEPLHASSLFLQKDRVALAQKLVESSFGDRVFFCNSGTEAIEGAIKFARKWANTRYGPEKHQVISFRNGFHGRSYGALSATAQEKFHEGFQPIVPGFRYLEPNDLDSLSSAASAETTCAVLLEPLQAEGGVLACDGSWVKKVREICTERNILLLLDEIQTGMGRLGTLWGYTQFGIRPDIMALAKALGGGVPFGAVVMSEKVSSCLRPGDHGNTTGGSPLAARLGMVVLEKLTQPSFMETLAKRSDQMARELNRLRRKHSAIREIRGRGMLWGLVLDTDPAAIIQPCRSRGLLVCKAGSDVLRLIPPLTVKPAVIREAMTILDSVLSELS